jgi:antitoxin component YwqK of YwqJK toxin-antitoxin module
MRIFLFALLFLIFLNTTPAEASPIYFKSPDGKIVELNFIFDSFGWVCGDKKAYMSDKVMLHEKDGVLVNDVCSRVEEDDTVIDVPVKDGYMTGDMKLTDKNGVTFGIIPHQNGVVAGTIQFYQTTKKLFYEIDVYEGAVTRLRFYFKSGLLGLDERMENGVRHGKPDIYYNNGEKFMELEYRNGHYINKYLYEAYGKKDLYLIYEEIINGI